MATVEVAVEFEIMSGVLSRILHYTLHSLYYGNDLLRSLGWVGGRGGLLRTRVSRRVILYCLYGVCVYTRVSSSHIESEAILM